MMLKCSECKKEFAWQSIPDTDIKDEDMPFRCLSCKLKNPFPIEPLNSLAN